MANMISAGPPRIPIRQSSMAAVQGKQLRNRSSRAELKRKFSALSDQGIERPLKLHIEEAELDREEAELEREEYQIRNEAGHMDEKTNIKAQRYVNERIISVGKILWDLKREEHKIKEKLGATPTLSPDTDDAFAEILLHLYKDPNMSKARSSTAKSHMRRDAIEAYGARPGPDAPHHKEVLKCMLSGKYFEKGTARTAHIVPATIKPVLADYIFGKGAGNRMFTADNCLMLHMNIEQALDSGNLTFVPIDMAENPLRRWKAVIVNEGSRNQFLSCVDPPVLGSLDGKEVEFLTDQRPASRFVYYHFVVTLLRLRRYAHSKWEQTWARYSGQAPFPTAGRYLRRSMLLTLARDCVSISDEELGKLVRENTFETAERLKDDQERELAREIHVAHQHLDEEKWKEGSTYLESIFQHKEEEEDDDEDEEEEWKEKHEEDGEEEERKEGKEEDDDDEEEGGVPLLDESKKGDEERKKAKGKRRAT